MSSHKTSNLDAMPEHQPIKKASSNAAGLGKLAAEIHIKIAEHSDDEELRALRRVCRALAKDTTDVFARRSFTEVAVELRDEGLRKFLEMTNIPEFAKHMKIIRFGDSLGELFTREEAFKSSQDIRSLEEISPLLVGSLRNLSAAGAGNTVVIGDRTPSRNHHLVGSALAESEHLIDHLACSTGKSSPQSVAAFELLDDQQIERLCRIFAKLQSLTLTLRQVSDFNQDAQWTVRRLLASANQIVSLELKCYSSTRRETVPHCLRIDHLRRLHLDDWHLNEAIMLSLLRQCRVSLKELMLTEGVLVCESDTTMAWVGIINCIADELRLTSFSADCLLGIDEDWHRRCFVDIDGNSEVEYKGSEDEVQAELKQLAEMGFIEGEDDDDDDDGYSSFGDFGDSDYAEFYDESYMLGY